MNRLFFASRPTPQQVDTALLIVRVLAGIIFMVHGFQKLNMGIDNVAGFFGSAGAPLPALTAPFVTCLEIVGGALLIIGLLTRPIAIMLAIDVMMATILVHRKNGFSGPGGMEFTLLLSFVALAFAIVGAGAYSVDGAIASRKTVTA